MNLEEGKRRITSPPGTCPQPIGRLLTRKEFTEIRGRWLLAVPSSPRCFLRGYDLFNPWATNKTIFRPKQKTLRGANWHGHLLGIWGRSLQFTLLLTFYPSSPIPRSIQHKLNTLFQVNALFLILNCKISNWNFDGWYSNAYYSSWMCLSFLQKRSHITRYITEVERIRQFNHIRANGTKTFMSNAHKSKA